MDYLGPDPAADASVATKKYVDDAGGGGGKPWHFNPPTAADFTLAHSGAGNLTLADDADVGLTILPPLFPSSTLNGSVATVATPAGDWAATARMLGTPFSVEYFGLGMVVMNSAGKLFTHGVRRYSTNISLMANAWNSLSSFNSDFIRCDTTPLSDLPWRRISYNATTGLLSFLASVSGKNWMLLGTDSAFFGGTPPDRVGFYMGAGGSISSGSPAELVCDYWDLS